MGIHTKECKIMVKGEYISEIYRWYTEESLFMVNRNYQRKLVWTLSEKQQFINTIIKNYPVPLFLVANTKEKIDNIEYPRKEIIDGLQRLEAIISFMQNEYAVKIEGKYQYFNLDVFPGNGILIRENKLKQKEPILDSAICREFMLYQLPITTIDADEAIVEDVFKRINSTGRKLSLQDLRQAGVTGRFSNLVRQTATRIRGDFTEDDLINLCEMHNYSLNSAGLHYGIDINTVFWIEQGIITEDGLRRSKDEEIIASLYNCILSNYSSGMSSKTLDRLYNDCSNIYKENESILTPGKYKELMQLFCSVISDFVKIFKIKQTTFESLLFKNTKNYNKDLVFIIIFLSFVQLKNEYYEIDDYVKVGDCLNDIADKELNNIISVSDCGWTVSIRNHLIERIKNCLRKGMVFKETRFEWSQELIDLLKRAEVEGQMYDFKIGMRDLRTGQFNHTVIPKCVKTLIAMANTNPNKEGIIILGISDKKSDALDFKNHYKVEPSKYGNYYITGIKEESIRYYGSIQNYIEKVKSIVETEDVLQSVIFDILTTIEPLKYNEHTLLVMRLKTNKPLFYKKQLFVRYQSDNKLIDPGSDEYYRLMEKFI